MPQQNRPTVNSLLFDNGVFSLDSLADNVPDKNFIRRQRIEQASDNEIIYWLAEKTMVESGQGWITLTYYLRLYRPEILKKYKLLLL